MADGTTHTEDWAALPWKKYQRNVYRLQRRIYRAARQGDRKRVHRLQRLLLRSWSARCLAVRRVTQENRGKRTPGVDGVAALTPKQRLRLAGTLRRLTDWTVAPIRRVYIPKPNNPNEKRDLGIPVMADRALQALVKQALEPEWEAVFEANSYGFRPGRSAHDAIEAVFNAICLKPKFVLDADIEKCFDRISHDALLAKLHAPQPVMRLARGWLKAEIMDKDERLFPEAGTPQGGVISPLLANVTLHGLESAVMAVSRRHRLIAIRYADDFVILCTDLATLLEAKVCAEAWLAEVGLRLKESKTHVTHTLDEHEGRVGFDFLGFHVRQYPVGKHRTRTYRGEPGFKTLIRPSQEAIRRHQEQIRTEIRQRQGAPQAALIAALNPIIRGWTLYYRTSVAKDVFGTLDKTTFGQLRLWTRHRHPRKSHAWGYRRYWRRRGTRDEFDDGTHSLFYHRDTAIVRHVKVRSDKSPYDGDWVYWGTRLGKDPTKPKRVTWLLRQQAGRCDHCGLPFGAVDEVEVHQRDGDRDNNRYANLALLHAHCHDQTHGASYQ
jgi:RNA-directed DNA polymerase